MQPVEVPWERRTKTVVIVAAWLALVVGMLTSLIEAGSAVGNVTMNAALGSAGVGAVWVLAITVIPTASLRRPLVLESLILFGVATTIISVALTGTTESSYLLLSVTPTMYAAIQGGFRVGLGTAGLSAALLGVVVYAQEEPILSATPNMALYIAVGATIAQIRKLLVDVSRRSAALELTTLASEQRLQSLEGAHTLLARLADLSATSETSPLAIARVALDMVCSTVPDSSALAAINGEEGPIVIARHGVAPEPFEESVVPLTVGADAVGSVTVRSPKRLSADQLDGLETSLRPLALAFANARMLQTITGNAIQNERVRLARELHDEIGPSLASLGLALDLALVQGASESEVTSHIEQLRGRVTDLVDEVRSTVSDLRSGRSTSLKAAVDRCLADSPTDSDVRFEVDERRPARPSINEAVSGVVGEALRNAILHASATTIRITGWSDFDRGRIAVEDDGTGFDPTELPKGHYGVIGMRERARDAGLTLDISSDSKGTRVLVEWS